MRLVRDIRPGLPFPTAAVRVSYARSGGPGGQNVNKVETKVVARLSLADLAVPPEDLARARAALASRLTTEGELLVTVSTTRSRARNEDEAFERLRDLVAAALRQRRARRPTRPTRSSKKRRLEGKKRLSDKKRLRGRPAE